MIVQHTLIKGSECIGQEQFYCIERTEVGQKWRAKRCKRLLDEIVSQSWSSLVVAQFRCCCWPQFSLVDGSYFEKIGILEEREHIAAKQKPLPIIDNRVWLDSQQQQQQQQPGRPIWHCIVGRRRCCRSNKLPRESRHVRSNEFKDHGSE